MIRTVTYLTCPDPITQPDDAAVTDHVNAWAAAAVGRIGGDDQRGTAVLVVINGRPQGLQPDGVACRQSPVVRRNLSERPVVDAVDPPVVAAAMGHAQIAVRPAVVGGSDDGTDAHPAGQQRDLAVVVGVPRVRGPDAQVILARSHAPAGVADDLVAVGDIRPVGPKSPGVRPSEVVRRHSRPPRPLKSQQAPALPKL